MAARGEDTLEEGRRVRMRMGDMRLSGATRGMCMRETL